MGEVVLGDNEFLEDVFFIAEGYMLLKETDEIVRNKCFCKLKSINYV
ncbi:MAG: hypothetical protein LM601_09820 [Candidatus Verstraetearchaeota archaeon]|nr:hypothetical protein [Candidatus Verstraetearchaeota archaeon]